MAANNDSNPTPTTEQPRLLDATSAEAYALWAQRVGTPLYHFSDRVGWHIRCPHCGGLRLLEIVTDSEMGTYFKPEPCACGGVP